MGCCCAKLEERVNGKFQGSQIIVKEMFWANLRYQRSAGCCQVQGNGVFVLTTDILWFKLVCGKKEIEIPLRNIRSVEIGPLAAPCQIENYLVMQLIIDYVDATSEIEDEVMITVRDPHHWKRLIDEAIIKKTSF